MSVRAFLRDRFLLLVLHLVCMGMLSVFLRLTGYNGTNVAIILLFWAVILTVWLVVTYLGRRKYFEETGRILENVDRRYLLGELLPASFRLEDRLYRDMIRRSNKSVIERIRQIEASGQEYREYIENWVHEVKAPITGISLLCENGRQPEHASAVAQMAASAADPGPAPHPDARMRETLRAVSMENQRIENYVDMALYYARSENVYKDFIIRRTSLQEIAEEVLEKNRLLLIKNGVRAEVDCPDAVYTDGKWIAFILNQLFLNCVKYRGAQPVLCVRTKRGKDGVSLTVEDNGVGIRGEELSRIFEKGFTGSNGRDHEQATGMGLYLCRKLCGRLGIGLRAESKYGSGTRMLLHFPVGNFTGREQD